MKKNIYIKYLYLNFSQSDAGCGRAGPAAPSHPQRGLHGPCLLNTQPIRASRRGSRGLFLPNRAWENCSQLTRACYFFMLPEGLAYEKIMCFFFFFFGRCYNMLKSSEYCDPPVIHSVIFRYTVFYNKNVPYFVRGFPLLLIILFNMFVMLCCAGSFLLHYHTVMKIKFFHDELCFKFSSKAISNLTYIIFF